MTMCVYNVDTNYITCPTFFIFLICGILRHISVIQAVQRDLKI